MSAGIVATGITVAITAWLCGAFVLTMALTRRD